MDIRALIKAGIQITHDEMDAAELMALMVIEQEIATFERELSEKQK
jgi:hypothetical protein